MLVPDRVYKENRANWNANYQQSDNLHGNTNWSLPTWKESPSRMWNQSNQSNQMKNSRKVSAKQHYLSVARYVAGQSTNLPSRYIKFPIQKILIACAMLVVCHFFLIRLQIRWNIFSEHLISMLKFMPFGKNHSRTRPPHDIIVCKSMYILTNIMQDLIAVLSQILFPLNILKIFEVFIGSVCQISIILHAAPFLHLCQALTHFIEHLVENIMIIANLLHQSTQSLVLYMIYALRYILAIIVLTIDISTKCLLHSLVGDKYILNGTSFYN